MSVPEQSSFPSPELALLDAFTGTWNTKGTLRDEKGATVPITGTDSYEWLPGGHFLVHKVDVRMGDERNQSTELIGYERESGTYIAHAFDDKGNITIMKMEHRDGTWVFENDTLQFTGGFSDNGRRLSGEWKQRDGAGWAHLMDIYLNKT